MKECPYCFSKQYYVKMKFSGSGVYQHLFNGEEAENGDMHEGLRYDFGKFAYCTNCNKRLFKVNDDGLEVE